LVISKKAK